MASIVDLDGAQSDVTQAGGKISVERARDIVLIGLRGRRLSWREIGAVLNVSHVAVQKRWRLIPAEVKRFYGGRALA